MDEDKNFAVRDWHESQMLSFVSSKHETSRKTTPSTTATAMATVMPLSIPLSEQQGIEEKRIKRLGK